MQQFYAPYFILLQRSVQDKEPKSRSSRLKDIFKSLVVRKIEFKILIFGVRTLLRDLLEKLPVGHFSEEIDSEGP